MQKLEEIGLIFARARKIQNPNRSSPPLTFQAVPWKEQIARPLVNVEELGKDVALAAGRAVALAAYNAPQIPSTSETEPRCN